MSGYVHSEFNPASLQAVAAGKTGKPEILVAAGAVSLATENTDIQTSSGTDIAMTLAAGEDFQRKTIALTVKGGVGNAVLTPAGGFTNAGAAVTTATFNTDGDFVILMFINGKWAVVVNSGCTIV